MAQKTEAQLVDRVSQVLEDTGNTHFADAAVIQPQLQDSLAEYSSFDPWIWTFTKTMQSAAKLGETLTRTHIGREVDITDIDRLISVPSDGVEYPIGDYPKKLRPFTIYGNTLILDIPTRPQAGDQTDTRGVTQTLTGTVTFTADSNAVTGSGTAFTSELEPGFYINNGDYWYRVASITDDTNLTLSINSEDTLASSTVNYWYQYVNITCALKHYVEATQTDLAGAIDAGVATGYAEDTWQINVDALGTGIMPKDMLFTIAGTEGVYRITEDATITSNEATLKISPRLKGRAGENAVVTFLPSSIPILGEELLCELAAAKVAINWQNISRTALANAVTAYGLANAAIDSITTVAGLINTQADSMVTAASANHATAITTLGKAETTLNTDAEAALDKLTADIEVGLGADGATVIAILDEASAEADLVVTDLSTARAESVANETAITTALTAMTNEGDQAIADLDTVSPLLNVVTDGVDPAGKGIQKAMAQIAVMNGKANEIRTLIAEGGVDNTLAVGEIRAAQTFMNEAKAKMAVEAQLTSESALEARERLRLAYGSIAGARGYLEADTRKVASLGQALMGYVRELQGDISQSSGYFNEASMSLRTVQVTNSITAWGRAKYADVVSRLKYTNKYSRSEATV